MGGRETPGATIGARSQGRRKSSGHRSSVPQVPRQSSSRQRQAERVDAGAAAEGEGEGEGVGGEEEVWVGGRGWQLRAEGTGAAVARSRELAGWSVRGVFDAQA